MTTRHIRLVVVSSLLVVLLVTRAPAASHVAASAGTPGTWSSTGNMSTARSSQTATLLLTGKVLVAGGCADAGCPPVGTTTLASAELYDPATGTWMATGSLHTARTYQTATLLQNGEVLIAGGAGADGALASTELYGPASGTWQPTGSMHAARWGHTATLLSNGQVLIAGGHDSSFNILASAELYNPATGTWTPTGAMQTARTNFPATLLANGKVLVAGGYGGSCCWSSVLSSAELYDPQSGTWTSTGSMTAAHADEYQPLSVIPVLRDGTALLAGGATGTDVTASAEVYAPSAGTWAVTGSMNVARMYDVAAVLATGQVLIAGGRDPGGNSLASAEVFDPNRHTWTLTSSMVTARQLNTATLLPSGQVLVTGGRDTSGNPLSSAELYTPLQEGTLVVSPTSGAVGQTITLIGTNFGLSEGVNIYADGTTASPLYTTATTANGTFVVTRPVVPLPYGRHTLIAVGQTSGRSASAPFLVRPRLLLQPSAGPGFSRATASGAGFAANEAVFVHWNTPGGLLLGASRSNVEGSFTGPWAVTFVVPPSSVGEHKVYAVGQTSGATAVAVFTVP